MMDLSSVGAVARSRFRYITRRKYRSKFMRLLLQVFEGETEMLAYLNRSTVQSKKRNEERIEPATEVSFALFLNYLLMPID